MHQISSVCVCVFCSCEEQRPCVFCCLFSPSLLSCIHLFTAKEVHWRFLLLLFSFAMSCRTLRCVQRRYPTLSLSRARQITNPLPLWRSHWSSCAPLRDAVSLRAASTYGLSLRQCHTRVPALSASATAGDATIATTTSLRDRFICPECGKRFLCAANVLQHRTSRHGLRVVTPQESARAVLVAQNAELRRELARRRARVAQLKEDDNSTNAISSATGSRNSHRSAEENSTVAAAADAVPAVSKSYPSAVLTGQLMEVDAELHEAWRRSGRALGTGVSFMDCIGTVLGPVQIGTLAGAAAGTAKPPRLLQFTLEAHGYRERRPGQLKLYRAQMLVRYLPSQPYHEPRCRVDEAKNRDGLFAVREGDVVRVQGHYGLHNSYDMVSKLPVENVVVEADSIGLLRSAGATQPTFTLPTATVPAVDPAHAPMAHSDVERHNRQPLQKATARENEAAEQPVMQTSSRCSPLPGVAPVASSSPMKSSKPFNAGAETTTMMAQTPNTQETSNASKAKSPRRHKQKLRKKMKKKHG